MSKIDRRALRVPREDLVKEIGLANEKKRGVLAARDAAYGAGRPRIGSYMENIALPELFGFDMNDYYRDPALALEVDLRHKLFWLDNSHDDGLAALEVDAGSMYFDMTLFGLHITYQPDGVPIFSRHPLAGDFDLSLLKPFDFYATGEMPMVHHRFGEMRRLSQAWYGGQVEVLFPLFHRGPLDIIVQLREYDQFVGDCADDPELVHRLLGYIVEQRRRFNEQAQRLRKKEGAGRPTSFVADDWVNVPFISPGMFDEFAVPAYAAIQQNEGTVRGFHTCGVFTPVVQSLLGVFPGIRLLEVSGWNDFTEVDRLVDPRVELQLNFINSFVLCSPRVDHEAKLREIRRIMGGRSISLNAQAIVKLTGTLDDSLVRMIDFIDLARETLAV